MIGYIIHELFKQRHEYFSYTVKNINKLNVNKANYTKLNPCAGLVSFGDIIIKCEQTIAFFSLECIINFTTLAQ